MSEYDDIQSQLKAWAGFVSSGYEVPAAGGTMSAAAAAIEALAKERDLWRSDADRQRQLREDDRAEVERLKGVLGDLQEDNMWLQVVQGNLRAIMRAHQKDCPNCHGKGSIDVPYDSADLNDTSTVTEDCKQCARLRSALEAKP